MSAYRIYTFIRAGAVAFVMVILGILAGVSGMCREISRELAYHTQWGENWRAKYEEKFGSVRDAQIKVAVTAIFLLVIGVLLVQLVQHLSGGHRSGSRKRRRHKNA